MLSFETIAGPDFAADCALVSAARTQAVRAKRTAIALNLFFTCNIIADAAQAWMFPVSSQLHPETRKL
jgi:hypothetical protein